MRLLKNRRLHFNMGEFEHAEVVATVEVDTIADAEALLSRDIEPSNLDAIHEFMDDQLHDLMASDVKRAYDWTDKDKSFAIPYYENNY